MQDLYLFFGKILDPLFGTYFSKLRDFYAFNDFEAFGQRVLPVP